MSMIIFFFRQYLSEFFTGIVEVVDEAEYVFRYIAFFHFIDSS